MLSGSIMYIVDNDWHSGASSLYFSMLAA